METPNWQTMCSHLHEFQKFSRIMLLQQKQTQLTTGELGVLSLLYLHQPLSPLQLSQHTGMKIESISRTLKHLLEKSYIQKQISPTDERSYLFSLTSSGGSLLNEEYTLILRPIYYLYKQMGQDFFQLCSLLSLANSTLEQYKEEQKQ